MRTSSAGLLLIERNEGYRSYRYLDATGTPTIGFGTTASVVDPLPATCTVAQATQWLDDYVERAVEPSLNAAITAIPKGAWTPNQNEYDALIDLGYNCGAGVFNTSWQIGRELRAGSRQGVYSSFLNYVYSQGVRLQGLVTRREQEMALFNAPVPQPPTPDPYAMFDKTVRTVKYDGRTYRVSEYVLAKQVDWALKRPRLRKGTCRMDLPRARAVRNRLVMLAHLDGGPPHWSTDHLGKRQAWWGGRISLLERVVR